MCSELLRIPYVWGGVPMFGYGVLLALWAVASAFMLAGLVRRHGWNGETWGFVPVILLVGAAIIFLPRVFPDGLPIRGYGVMLLAGGAVGVAMAALRARQVGLDPEIIFSLAFWLFIGGILGARLFYVVEYWEQRFSHYDFRQRIFEILNFPQGGLVVYGALFGAGIAFVMFARKHRLPILPLADLIAPSLAFGLALGRIGCLLNGCCYGGPSDLPWAVTFPAGSPAYEDEVTHGDLYGFHLEGDEQERPLISRVAEGATTGLTAEDRLAQINGHEVTQLDEAKALVLESFAARQPLTLKLATGKEIALPAITPPARSRPVHPAQIYSAIDAGLLGWLAWAFYPFRRRDGEVIALLLTIHPITRFLLEIIRIDEPAVFGTGMSISQNISVAIFVFAMGLWWYLSRQPRGVTWGVGATGERPIGGRALATGR